MNWLDYVTEIVPGHNEFMYAASAPHRIDPLNGMQGYFDVYITKNVNDGSKDLDWNDLETTPFCTFRRSDGDQTRETYTSFPCQVPDRQGIYTLYTIWQRSDSTEAFYSCSDVKILGSDEVITTVQTRGECGGNILTLAFEIMGQTTQTENFRTHL